MPDMKVETKLNPRQTALAARDARLKLVNANRVATVKVWPGNDLLRRILRHPSGGIRFLAEGSDATEWPNDSFTHRRIADGSVRTDGPGPAKPESPDPKLGPRAQAAARRKQQQQPKAKPSSTAAPKV